MAYNRFFFSSPNGNRATFDCSCIKDIVLTLPTQDAALATVPQTAEVNLGSTPRQGGSFDLQSAFILNTGTPALVAQAAGPYTNKGTLPDEAEMDFIGCTAYVLNTGAIRAYWNSNTFVIGNFKFNYHGGI